MIRTQPDVTKKPQQSQIKKKISRFTNLFKPNSLLPPFLAFLVHKHFFEIFLKHTIYFFYDSGDSLCVEYLLVSIYGILQSAILLNSLINLIRSNQTDAELFWKKVTLVIGGQLLVFILIGSVQLVYNMSFWDHRHLLQNGLYVGELVKFSSICLSTLLVFIVLVVGEFERK